MNVLIPIDGPELLDDVISCLSCRAPGPTTAIRLLHVVEYQPTERSMVVSSEIKVFLEHETKAAEAWLRVASGKIQRAFPDTSVDTKVCQGTAAGTILEEAASWPANLVVVGSNGRNGVAKLILGSVARTIATHCSCSVILIRRKKNNDEKLTQSQTIDARPIRI